MGLKYYADLNDAPVTDLLRQASIKTKNHFMDFSDSSCQDCPDTGRSTGAYIILYQGGQIDHGTHVPGKLFQPQMRQFTYWTSTVLVIRDRFRVHVLGSKTVF